MSGANPRSRYNGRNETLLGALAMEQPNEIRYPEKPKEGKSRPTPEFPGLSVLKNEEVESSMSRTPDSPELTYFNKL